MSMFSMRRLVHAGFCPMLCLVLAAPAAMHAQTAPASGNTAISPAESYTAVLSNLEKEIVGAADAMPADKYDFAPSIPGGDFKGVNTFAAQVKHLAAANYEFFEGWGIAGAVDPKTITALKTKPEIMKALRDSYVYAHAAVNSITVDNAFTSLPGPSAYKATRASTAALCMAHSMDHYGQLVEYLRMNGIIPPASRKG
jgi:hypothetical protein